MSNAKLRRSCLEDLKSLNELYQDAVLSETELAEQNEKILLTLKDIDCYEATGFHNNLQLNIPSMFYPMFSHFV